MQTFSPVCLRMCNVKSFDCVNARSQSGNKEFLNIKKSCEYLWVLTGTLIWSNSGMYPHMSDEFVRSWEAFAADGAETKNDWMLNLAKYSKKFKFYQGFSPVWVRRWHWRSEERGKPKKANRIKIIPPNLGKFTFFAQITLVRFLKYHKRHLKTSKL